jgi:phosphate transport system substrate-binding protein
LFLPSLAGGLGIVYNLPGNPQLNFNPAVLGQIFIGTIEMWNDPLIQALNRNITLPVEKINAVGRSGKSGSTKVFTNYLSKYSDIEVSSSPEWYVCFVNSPFHRPSNFVTRGTALELLYVVETMQFAITYAPLDSLVTAADHIGTANIINKAGNAIYPSTESLQASMTLSDENMILYVFI